MSDEVKEIALPDLIPTYEEAWNLYMINENYNYEQLAENIYTAELNTKTIHKQYLTEVQIFDQVRNVFCIRKDEVYRVCLVL